MEIVFIAASLALSVATFLTMVRIVREVLPNLSEEDQARLRGWTASKRQWKFNGTIHRAWNYHVRLFPKSCKRLLFACLFTACLLSIFAFPVWLALAVR